LRIIAGVSRGRRLVSPGQRFGKLVRPTSDRAREAIFNVLADKVEQALVLDLFAGTGALGLEALSRGAAQAVFVEANRQVVELIRQNIAACGFIDESLVLQRDLAKGPAFLAKLKPASGFDLVFLDPPYGMGLGHKVMAGLVELELVASHGIIVVEDRAGEEYPALFGDWFCYDRRRYGEAGFWLYRQQGENESNE